MKDLMQFFFFVTMRFPVRKNFSNILTNATKFLGFAESKQSKQFSKQSLHFAVS